MSYHLSPEPRQSKFISHSSRRQIWGENGFPSGTPFLKTQLKPPAHLDVNHPFLTASTISPSRGSCAAGASHQFGETVAAAESGKRAYRRGWPSNGQPGRNHRIPVRRHEILAAAWSSRFSPWLPSPAKLFMPCRPVLCRQGIFPGTPDSNTSSLSRRRLVQAYLP